jgi:chromosome segregation protein
MGRVRLESLQLTGFKSFPDAVELTFPSDVSAIIGPNGCGKSNVVDAILWVLGEQSPTLLRLKNMGDVVFSGAASRPPAGAAEVGLILKSDDGRWEETGGRLEITRRVYSSGPSEYRLNGKTARLKDVVDELLGVGLGTRDYSIIEQGRVGQVLSARPTDRRVLIEEAAGITRYKVRRHEAELKLEHTRQNLLRLDDVIGEVDRTLRQLKRQARQAERHHKMETELREALEVLRVLEAHRLEELRADARRRRGEAQNEVAAAASALGSAEADVTAARNALDSGRSEVEEARVEVSRLLNSRERLEAFLERSADLLDNLRGSLERTRRERATLASSRSALEQKLETASGRADELTAEHGKVRAAVSDAELAAKEARSKLDVAESDAGRTREDLLRTISTLTDSRNRLGDLDREQDRLAYALTQLEQERERVAARHDDVERRWTEATATTRTAREASERLASRRTELAGERDRLAQQATAARQEAQNLGQAAWELRHRLAGVDSELARHAAAADQLAELLPGGVVQGVVGDVLDPEPQLAALLDRAWGELLELPVVDLDHLSPDLTAVLGELDARPRLVLAGGSPEPLQRPTPDGAEDLLARSGADAGALGWLTRILPPTWRTDDASTALRLADEHPEAVVLGPDGLLLRGRIAEPEAGRRRTRGALELKRERQRLSDDIDATATKADASDRTHRELEEQNRELVERLAVVESELVEAEQERARASAVEQSLAQELDRLRRELEAIDADTTRDRATRDQLVTKRERLLEEVEGLQRRAGELEQAVETAAAGLDGHRETASEAIRRLDRWRGEAALAREREEAAVAERDRLTAELGGLDERLEALAKVTTETEAELGRTEEEVVRSRTRLAEEQGLLSAARDQERRLGEELQKRGTAVEKLEREVRERRETHQRVRDTLHEIEVEQTRLEGEWDLLRDHAASELSLAPEALLDRPRPDEVDTEALGERIETLRRKLESLGPVNLLALKELEELEERSTFLAEQRKDLVESLKSLDATIRDIDATCTERFVATFEQVNEVFNETFSHLFGGGTARLDLVDEDNPLESGIDITAQPPGKKNQSVQLLSGGEKALAALSLLIALFRIKPSPFCILDEVDAPLDDANVERLNDLVRSMTEHTQFVLITHNRRTMQRADVLYGVTMEEPGVSKVVTVRLES